MVANKIMVGKDEKLRVSAVFSATMMISRASKMLRVKKKSSITGGKGKINMVRIRMTAIGIANDVHGTEAVSCRSSDRLIAEVAI
jgi:hypothetical protein